LTVPSDLVGLSDLTRVNGLNGKGGLVSGNNWDVGRSRNENRVCVMSFGAGDVIAAVVVVVVDDAVVAVDDGIVGDGTVGDADVDDAVGAVDDVADFDDNSGKLVVYYDDFDNNFDMMPLWITIVCWLMMSRNWSSCGGSGGSVRWVHLGVRIVHLLLVIPMGWVYTWG